MPAEDIHFLQNAVAIPLVPQSEFQRVTSLVKDTVTRLSLIADMNRVNVLSVVKRAGSGHLGSSLSAMDIVTWLYYHEMNTVQVGIESPDRDIYFSSKGHDVPGQYAVLYSLGIVARELLLKLRRLGGLEGHPDVGTPGIESNSGSLGMGISKGKGMAWAKTHQKFGGRVFVLIGDGELQEGQNYEAFQSAAHQKIGNLIVIVDHNKVQSDKQVSEMLSIGDLDRKFEAFGWHVARCDGHDFHALEQVFAEFRTIVDRPKILIADTIKGRGVSFMEHPFALAHNNNLYPWHAGAPDDEAYQAAQREIMLRLDQSLADLGLDPLATEDITPEKANPSGVTPEYVVHAYGDRLAELGAKHKNLVVLDADLAADCRLRNFERAFPDRFIENGIAEQDMVSMACGLASQGMLPVVNSFASFLISRANEQIYNSASEHRKIIYGCNFGGLIPAGPGKSHQSLRDISLLGALPNMTILQPCNREETRQVVDYCVETATESCTIRLVIGPSPRTIALPDGYKLTPGRGCTLRDGADALLFAYGPVMLDVALTSSEILSEKSYGVKVVNMPWLNRIDDEWLTDLVQPYKAIFVLEDHAPVGGLADFLLGALSRLRLLDGRFVDRFAVEGYPAFGTPPEVLKYHRLDGHSLAERIWATRS